jgi:hypothetical protein
VAFTQSRRGNPQETRLPLQLSDVARAAVSHAGFQAAYQLVDEIGQRSFGRNPVRRSASRSRRRRVAPAGRVRRYIRGAAGNVPQRVEPETTGKRANAIAPAPVFPYLERHGSTFLARR